jgi:hypothetical protein
MHHYGTDGYHYTNQNMAFWSDCPPQDYDAHSDDSGTNYVRHTFALTCDQQKLVPANYKFVEPTAAAVCGCAPKAGFDVIAGVKHSSVLVYPESCTNFAGTPDLYVYSARTTDEGYQNSVYYKTIPFCVPSRTSALVRWTVSSGWINGTLQPQNHQWYTYSQPNTNRVVGISATNVFNFADETALVCPTNQYNGAYQYTYSWRWFAPRYYWDGSSSSLKLTNAVILNGDYGPYSAPMTNFAVPIYANEIMWNDLGTGLTFDDPNNAGMWQRFGGAGAAGFYPAIAFDDFVGTGLGNIPTNDFVNGWAIDDAVALIKWDSGTNGFHYHAKP